MISVFDFGFYENYLFINIFVLMELAFNAYFKYNTS
jgi:hypothetical protein